MADHTFYEFFAGGGMARAGLGEGWKCVFANDFDLRKVSSYRSNWGANEIVEGDIHDLDISKIPSRADLAWASFPCQDLSLAGNGKGLNGERSGAFWGFWDIIQKLKLERRAPSVLVIENVIGALTSNKGRDFSELCRALKLLGYRFGAMVIDASLFLPQSRPRLFIVAIQHGVTLYEELLGETQQPEWTSVALNRAWESLSPDLKKEWIWWRLPVPEKRNSRLIDLIEIEPIGVDWHTPNETARVIAMMSDTNLAKLDAAKKIGKRTIGTIYKRMRDEGGERCQRAELRFDDVAGCLRTPGGGSSRQIIIEVNGLDVKTRLISSREAARLMGLNDSYILPKKYNEAYHLMGDGLVVPVVKHLKQWLLSPISEGFEIYYTSVAAE